MSYKNNTIPKENIQERVAVQAALTIPYFGIHKIFYMIFIHDRYNTDIDIYFWLLSTIQIICQNSSMANLALQAINQ